MRLKELLHHLYLGVHRSPDLGDVEERGWVLVPPGPQLLQRPLPRVEEVPGGAQQPGPGVPLVQPVAGQLRVPPPPLLRRRQEEGGAQRAGLQGGRRLGSNGIV